MGGVQATAHLRDDRNRGQRVAWPQLVQPRLQILTVNELHDQIDAAVGRLRRVENGDDVLVLDRRCELGLPIKASAERGVVREIRPNDLQRDVAFKAQVSRAIDNSHTPDAQALVEAVAVEDGPNSRVVAHGRSLRHRRGYVSGRLKATACSRYAVPSSSTGSPCQERCCHGVWCA